MRIYTTGPGTVYAASILSYAAGYGYQTGDVVRLVGGNNNATISIGGTTTQAGTQATGTATISNSGIVTGVTITNPGLGYYTAPTVTFGRSPAEKTGEVKAWDSANRTLTVINRSGDLTGTLDGGTSNAQWDVETYSTIDNTNSDFDQNKYIETTADGFLDFTEGNPFGEFGNQGTSL